MRCQYMRIAAVQEQGVSVIPTAGLLRPAFSPTYTSVCGFFSATSAARKPARQPRTMPNIRAFTAVAEVADIPLGQTVTCVENAWDGGFGSWLGENVSAVAATGEDQRTNAEIGSTLCDYGWNRPYGSPVPL